MKTISYFALALMLFGSNISKAQNQYSTNAETTLELESMMVSGNALNVRYFYYPNLQAYFDRQTSTYLYSRNGQDWIESSKLPNALRGYSVANNKRVPLTDYAGDSPYELIKEHMKQFPANYSSRRQPKNDKEKPADMVAMK